MSVEDFPTRVRRLARERGTSITRLVHDAWDPQKRGTSPDLARKVLAGRRTLTPTLVEAVARALDVQPDEFPEYRLAIARRLLDEREVGLDTAVANLARAPQLATSPSAGSEPALPADEAPPRERGAAQQTG